MHSTMYMLCILKSKQINYATRSQANQLTQHSLGHFGGSFQRHSQDW